MSDLTAHIEQSIRSRRLLHAGQKVLLAVSGGLDSMVLLSILSQLAPTNRWKLSVAHFDHRLRGRSSDADERLVRATARKHKLPYFVERCDVRVLARVGKLSLEMAARKARHEFLARIALSNRIPTVALAHHGDDQVELFFLRLFRGSGRGGLAGMQWSNPSPANPKIQLMRPFLDLPKTALIDYAREAKIKYREDASNRSMDFQRNRIRHELLPLLTKKYQPALSTTIARVIDIVSAESEWLDEVATDWLDKKNILRAPAKISQFPFEKLPVAIQRRCLHLQLVKAGRVSNYDLIENLRLKPGQQIDTGLSGEHGQIIDHVLREASGKLHFASRLREQTSISANHVEANLQKRGTCVFEGTKISWRAEITDSISLPKRRPRQETFDADLIGPVAVLRHWLPGDRFQPIGMASAVKLQDLFVNQKVPQARRHKLLIATTLTGEIFWVESVRISERFKLSHETKRRLIWRWRPS